MGLGIGNGKGGARKGAGRPKGSKDRRKAAVLEAALAGNETPLAYMMRIFNDPAEPKEMRFRAAKECAPFVHARLAPIAATPVYDQPAEELDDQIADIERWVAEHTRGSERPVTVPRLLTFSKE
jgi:hypothetical protein